MVAGKKCLSLALVLTLIIVLVYTPATIHSQGSNSGEKCIVDAIGRTVCFTKTPSRVVSLAPSITELLFALELEEYIIGVDSISYNDSFYGIAGYVRSHSIADVGGYWWSTIKLEEILALKPDLVIADKGAHISLIDFFNDNNITVVYLHGGSASSIEDVYSDIDIVSTIFDKTETARQIILDIDKAIARAGTLVHKYHGTRVLVVVGIWNGVWVAGKSTYIDDLLSRLGLVNVASVIGWKPVGIEEIASWSPDVVLVATGMGIDNSSIRDAGLYDIGADIVLLNSTETDMLCRPGPLVGYAVSSIAYRVSSVLEKRSGISVSTAIANNETTIGLGSSALNTSGSKSGGGGSSNYLLLSGVAVLSCIVGVAIGYVVFRRTM